MLPPAIQGNTLARGVAKLETRRSNMRGSAFEWGKMVDDTMSSTGSRLLVSNSKAEAVEVTVTETIESLIVYFGVSALANKYLLKPFARLAKLPKAEFKNLKQALVDMPKANLIKHIPARLGTIVAAMGTTLFFGEFAILFGKNIGSAKLFNSGSFAQLLDLKHNQPVNGQDPEVAETLRRSKKGLKYSIGLGLASIATAMGIARFGPKLLTNVATKRLEHFRKVLSNTFGGLDFKSEIRKLKSGKEVKRLGLNLGLIRAYMATAGVGYMLSARDKLERMEILPRFTVIFLYMGWFNHHFDQKLLLPFFKKRLPELISGNKKDGFKVRSFDTLTKGKVFKAVTDPRQRRLAAGKATLFLTPYVVGMGLVSFLNAAINRYLTYQRFEHGEKAQALKTFTRLSPLKQKPHLVG